MNTTTRGYQDIPAKKLAGEISPEENLLFEIWLREGDNRQLYQVLENIKLDYDYDQALKMKGEVLEKTFNKIFLSNEHPRKKKNTFAVLFAVASFALLTSLGFIYFGQDRIEKSTALITLSCPSGLATIVLPDSSVITLNTGSTLTYPADFDKTSREVSLTGEAFFDIRKDSGHPFIVSTEWIEIKVLGTKFNLRTYPDEDEITTGLVSGSVEIKEKKQNQVFHVLPDQLATYNKKTAEMHFQQADLEYATGWVSGGFLFKRMSFHSICNMLERRFGVHFNIKNPIFQEKLYTGKFVNNESLSQILEVIKINRPFSYSIKNNVVTIY